VLPWHVRLAYHPAFSPIIRPNTTSSHESGKSIGTVQLLRGFGTNAYRTFGFLTSTSFTKNFPIACGGNPSPSTSSGELDQADREFWQ
jgi:hypothetical protein